MTEKNPADNFPAGYEVPKVWVWEKGNGGQFANINRPIAGPTKRFAVFISTSAAAMWISGPSSLIQ